MAVPETTRNDDADAAAHGAAAPLVGPLRDPDACVLACPDCSCRRLLEERRGCERGGERARG